MEATPPGSNPEAPPSDEARPGPEELRRRYARTGLWWTSAVSYRIGAVVAWIAEPLGLSPNAITLLSLATTAVGAAALLLLPDPASPPSIILLFVSWQLAYGLDCADGVLARRLGRSSAFGAWLDQVVDLVGHVVLFGAMSAYVADDLALDPRLAALLAVFVVGGNSVLGVALGLRSATVGRETVAFDRPRLGWFARMLHLVDYGFVLAVSALLVPAAPALGAYLVVVAMGSVLALAGLAFLLWRRVAPERPSQ